MARHSCRGASLLVVGALARGRGNDIVAVWEEAFTLTSDAVDSAGGVDGGVVVTVVSIVVVLGGGGGGRYLRSLSRSGGGVEGVVLDDDDTGGVRKVCI